MNDDKVQTKKEAMDEDVSVFLEDDDDLLIASEDQANNNMEVDQEVEIVDANPDPLSTLSLRNHRTNTNNSISELNKLRENDDEVESRIKFHRDNIKKLKKDIAISDAKLAKMPAYQKMIIKSAHLTNPSGTSTPKQLEEQGLSQEQTESDDELLQAAEDNAVLEAADAISKQAKLQLKLAKSEPIESVPDIDMTLANAAEKMKGIAPTETGNQEIAMDVDDDARKELEGFETFEDVCVSLKALVGSPSNPLNDSPSKMLAENDFDRYESAVENLHENSALDQTIDPDVTVPDNLGESDFPANKLSLTTKLNELVKILPTQAGIDRENKSTGRVYRTSRKESSNPGQGSAPGASLINPSTGDKPTSDDENEDGKEPKEGEK